MKKYFTIGGGLGIALSMLLPFTSILGVSINGFKMGGVAWFYIICGIGIAAVGYFDKKKLYLIPIIIGLLVTLLAMKYQSDTKTFKGAAIGIGLWLMLFSGLISFIGGIIGFRSFTTNKSIPV